MNAFKLRLVLAISVGLLSLPLQAQQTVTWTNADEANEDTLGSWSDSGNWSPMVVPGPLGTSEQGDYVIIGPSTSSVSNPIVLDTGAILGSTTVSLGSLTFQNTTAVEIDAASSLMTVTGSITNATSGNQIIHVPVTLSPASHAITLTGGTAPGVGSITFNNNLIIGTNAVTISPNGTIKVSNKLNFTINSNSAGGYGTILGTINATGASIFVNGTYTSTATAAANSGNFFQLTTGNFMGATAGTTGTPLTPFTDTGLTWVTSLIQKGILLVQPTANGGENFINAGVTLPIDNDAEFNGTPTGTNASAGSITFKGGSLVTTNNTLNTGIAIGTPFSTNRLISVNTTGGTIVATTATTATYNGVISDGNGSGSITIGDGTNTGTVIFTANNTYTGTTTISSGTLQLGTGGATGSIAGDVVNNAALVFDVSGTVTFGGQISQTTGAGSLTQSGTGTLILTGQNGYSGTTTINTGSTLQVGNGGSSGGPGSGSIVDNGTLILDRSDTVNDNDVISGSGNIIQEGSGTLVVSTANTYQGGSTISNGIVQLSGTGTLGDTAGTLAITTGGALDLNGTNQTVGAFTLSTGDVATSTGTSTLNTTGVTVSGTANTIHTGVTVTGSVTQNTNSALTVNGSIGNDSLAVQAALQGTGVVGTLVLAGTNTLSSTGTLTTGGITVNGVNNAISSGTVTGSITQTNGSVLTVNGTAGDDALTGASLNGTGTVGRLTLVGSNTWSNTLSSTGTLTTGGITVSGNNNVIGSGTITGSITQTVGSVLTVNGTVGDDAMNQANLTGTGTLGRVTLGNGSYLTSSGTLTTAGLTVNGTDLIGPGTITGSITQNASSSLTVNGNVGDDSLATLASLSGTGTVGSVTMAGLNTLSSSGTLTTGGITVNAGNNNITSGTITGSITQNANSTLAVNGTAGNDALANSATLGGSGTVGVLTLAGSNTLSSRGTLTTGGITVNGSGNLIDIGTIAGNATLGSRAGLVVNGALNGTVSVGNGTLGGTGSTGAVTVGGQGGINLQDGIIGTLTVGSLNIGSTGLGYFAFDIGAGSTGNLDNIVDTGALTLGASPVTINIGNVSGTPSLTAGTYTLITYSGVANTSNLSLSTTSLDGMVLSLVETAGSVELMVAPPPGPPYTLTTAATDSRIISGQSTTLTTSITDADATDAMNFTGLGATSSGTITGSTISGTLAANGGQSTNSGQTFTGGATGAIAITPTTATVTNITGAQAPVLTTSTGTTVDVVADRTITSGTTTVLGRVINGSTLSGTSTAFSSTGLNASTTSVEVAAIPTSGSPDANGVVLTGTTTDLTGTSLTQTDTRSFGGTVSGTGNLSGTFNLAVKTLENGGSGLTGEGTYTSVNVTYTADAVDNRTESATSVDLGRVMVGQTPGSLTTTISSVTGQDTDFTRTTLSGSTQASSVTNGTITLGSGTAYQFGGANDGVNSTTRGVTGDFTAAGTQIGTATFTPIGEGLNGESVNSIGIAYTADAVNNRTESATSVALGRVMVGQTTGTQTTTVSSVTGDDTTLTRTTLSGSTQASSVTNGTITLNSGTSYQFGGANDGVNSTTRGVTGDFTTAGTQSGTATFTPLGEGLTGESVNNIGVTYTADAVNNRTESATSVALGRVLVGQTTGTQTTTVSSVTGQDTTLTRTTLSGSTQASSVTNGTITLNSGTSYQFGGANDGVNSTTRGVTGDFTTAGTQSGTATFTPMGEGLTGESVNNIGVAYTADAVNNRTESATSVALGRVMVGQTTGTQTTTVSSVTGQDTTLTRTTLSGSTQAASVTNGSITLDSGTDYQFGGANDAVNSTTRGVTGDFTVAGTQSGTATFTPMGEGLTGESVNNIGVTYTADAVNNRTESATSVDLGRVMVGNAGTSQTTTISSTTGLDTTLTRTTLSGSVQSSSVTNGTITLGTGTAYQFGGANDAVNSTTRGVTGDFTVAGTQSGTATFTPVGEGLTGESVNSLGVAFVADAVNNRTESATSVALGRVMVGQTTGSLTTTISSVTGQDSTLTRTTLSGSTQSSSVTNGTITLGTGTAYQFGGANDAVNSTTRNVTGSFTVAGTQSGTATFTPAGEGLNGESVNAIGLTYSADAVNNRTESATSVDLGRVMVGQITGTQTTTISSVTGQDTTLTRTTLGAGSQMDSVTNGSITLGSGTAYQFGSTNDAVNSTTRSITGSFTVAGNQSGSATFTPTGEGLTGESVNNIGVTYAADAVNNRTESATSVNLGRVMVGQTTGAQTTTISSVTGQDSTLTRTTLGASSQMDSVTNGSITLGSGTAYQFGNTNDAVNSTTRGITGNFTVAGTQSGSTTFTLTGEGLTGESVNNIGVTYTADAVNMRVVTNGGTTSLGTLHNGAAVNTTSAAFTTTTGDNLTETNVTVAQNGSGSTNGISATGSAATLFNGSTGSDTRTLTGNISNSTGGLTTGTINLGVTGEGLVGEGSYSPVAVAYTAFVYTGQGVWNTNGGGSWGTVSAAPANWVANGGTPGLDSNFISTDSATFDNTALTTGSSATVTLDGDNPSLKAITFNTTGSGSYTIAQGTGGVLKLNNGTGTATITDNGGSHTISAPMEFDSNVMVAVANIADTLTLSGGVALADGASFSLGGAGTVALGGSNAFTGGVNLSSGTLSLLNNNALPMTGDIVLNGGTLNLNGTSQSVGNLSGAGGTIAGTAGSSITVNETTDPVYAGTITGATAVTYNSSNTSGNLLLTGQSTYTGGTTINGGIIAVGSAPMAGMGALGNGNVMMTGGILTSGYSDPLATGNTNHVIQVNGNYTQTGGTLSINLNSVPSANPGIGDSNDVLKVAGTAVLNGNLTVAITPSSSFIPTKGQTFEVVQSGGIIGTPGAGFTTPAVIQTGTGIQVTTSESMDNDNFFVIINATQLELNTVLGSYATPNRLAIATAVDNGFMSGPVYNAFASIITNPAAVASALDQNSQEKFGNFVRSTVFNNASFSTQQLDGYLQGLRSPQGDFLGGTGQIDSSGLTVLDPNVDSSLSSINNRLLAWNPAPYTHGLLSDSTPYELGGIDMKDSKNMTANTTMPNNEPWDMFVSGNVILGQNFSQNEIPFASTTTSGVQLGADYRITPHLRVGALFSYGHTNSDLDTHGSNATVDSFSPGVFASYANNGWYANVMANYGFNNFTEARNISFGGLSGISQGSPNGNQVVADFDGGYDFNMKGWTFGPTAGMQFVNLTVDSFNESGFGLLDQKVNREETDSLRSRLGGHIAYVFQTGKVLLTPHLDASWQHEFLDNSQGITSQFSSVGSGSFTINTPAPSRDSALIDCGLTADLNRRVSIFGDYLVQAGQSNYFGQSVQAGLKIGF